MKNRGLRPLALLALTALTLPNPAHADCTPDQSPAGSCANLQINNPNETIDVGSAVTVSIGGAGTTALNNAGTGLTLSVEGTVSGAVNGGDGITNSGGITSLTNSGTIGGGDLGLDNAGSVTAITNNGTGTLSGDTAGIFNEGAGSIGTLTNSGAISSGSFAGIYSAGSITTLTNNSDGSISGVSYGLINTGGSINAIINSGTISSGSKGILNSGTITTLTNTGSITGPIAGILNQGTVTTLNNLQGKSSTALTYADNLPVNYYVIINTPTTYGQLAASNVTGTMNFGIYTGSTVASGTTYASVLSGITPSNLSDTMGTYGTYDWQLVENGADIWDLLVTGGPPPLCASDQSPAGSCVNLQISNANESIDVASGITVSIGGVQSQAINNNGTGLTLTVEGTVDGTVNGGTGVVNNGSIVSLTNSGTIEGNIGIDNAGSITAITNNSAGTMEGDTEGILNEGAGSISAISNSGAISSDDFAGIVNSGTITTILNSGSGSISGSSAGIQNDGGSINAIVNSGTISGGSEGVVNDGTVATLTNTGSITGGIAGILNNHTITTLNNLQGKGGTALTFGDNLPASYNIIINSPTAYGQLAASNATGTMNFGIYTGSTVASGTTYASVLSGIAPGNLSATTGTYGSYDWQLVENGADIWDLLVTRPPPLSAVQSSVQRLAGNLGNSVAQSNVTGVNLLGATRPITHDSYVSTGGMLGSAEGFFGGQHAVGAVTLLGGISYGQQDYRNVEQSDSVTIALAARHTFEPVWRSLRAYVEIGGWTTPNETLTLTRPYDNVGTPAQGRGSSEAYALAGYGRAGLVYDLTARDQLVAYGELGRQALHHDDYSEVADASNPFPASVSSGMLRYDVTRWGGTITHTAQIADLPVTATLSGAVAHSFDPNGRLNLSVAGVGSVQQPGDTATWGEFGAQVGVQFTTQLSGSLGLLGTSGNSGMGTQLHGLAGLAYHF